MDMHLFCRLAILAMSILRSHGCNLNDCFYVPLYTCDLSNCESVDISDKILTGTIPNGIYSDTKLTSLDLSMNDLTGTISNGISSLNQLTHLDLGSNQLTGTIPNGVSSLTKLTSLALDCHAPDASGSLGLLSGTIPNGISSLTKLTSLHLRGNELTGTIPNGISSLNQLTSLDLSSNELTGTIPNGMPLPVDYMDLSDNARLEGPIPVAWCQKKEPDSFCGQSYLDDWGSTQLYLPLACISQWCGLTPWLAWLVIILAVALPVALVVAIIICKDKIAAFVKDCFGKPANKLSAPLLNPTQSDPLPNTIVQSTTTHIPNAPPLNPSHTPHSHFIQHSYPSHPSEPPSPSYPKFVGGYDQMDSTKHQKFIGPVCGFLSMPETDLLTSLAKVKELCVHLKQQYPFKASLDIYAQTSIAFVQHNWQGKLQLKYECRGMTQARAAFINFYTLESPFYPVLNKLLRNKSRTLLKPYMWFFKSFLSACYCLPLSPQTVHRGVKANLKDDYEVGKTVTWWSITSTTEKIGVLQSPQFLGDTGERTMFVIAARSLVSIKDFSDMDEEEIILLPGTVLQVTSVLVAGGGLTMIQMKEAHPFSPQLDFVHPQVTDPTIGRALSSP